MNILLRFCLCSALLSLVQQPRPTVSAEKTASSKDSAPPNIVLIVCDNLGYGDIEPFGSQLHRTPSLNRMAKEGRKFTHFCVTAGVCTPSRASFMTGCYSQRVGMHDNPRDGLVLRPVSPYGLHPEETTIAETLKQAEYKTAIIGKWHLGDQPSFLPTAQGFDYFFGIPYSDDMTARDNWPPLPLMHDESVIEAPADRDTLTKRYTERATEFIRQHSEEPFFLYLPHAMPGSTPHPYSSADFQGKSGNGPWGDSIEELDWSVGEILDTIKAEGIAEQTLVIWTSDNGAPLAKDIESPTRGSNKPLPGRGYTTAEGAFRVPALMWWPGHIPAGTECDELVTCMDILPTAAALAGTGLPARPIDGHDVLPLMLGDDGAQSPYDAFYYYHQDQLQAVRKGPWKLFIPLTSFSRHPYFKKGKENSLILFNVQTDFACEQNVADQHPEIVKQLLRLAEVARVDLGDTDRKGAGQRTAGHVENPTPRVKTAP
ncbi:sulfatase family protein [Rubinisphaera brasiliensis]|uniref:Cerebroside-sulfatase n=1 Tax=Rubinisphaera brasiliensis (strain ATCC 49424 / DSM 5305 / JCM 21570 / IAM 15109 / NBRC 103401 / IFAM 1448) TaxID=756272 RepID=F0SK78_RUBBR|nr:sulfatase [Rubinisphaera brasiliensis]ADY60835.1 Cerebroside-sulfatase [Rubinisphaera brasiliensis DSM 5305]